MWHVLQLCNHIQLVQIGLLKIGANTMYGSVNVTLQTIGRNSYVTIPYNTQARLTQCELVS